jgi:molybdenum cofactor biosynthesis enzyme MoaA
MEFGAYGLVQACCANAMYPIGDVRTQTLDEIWSGPRVRQLRASLRAGDLRTGCGVCRFRLAHESGELPRDYYDLFGYRGGPDPLWPKILTFSLHNTCNLECVMCGGDESSRIRTRRDGLPPLPHVYGDRFFEELRPFLRHCEFADFVGGEPFLVREHQRVWDLLIAEDLPVKCSATTNGTIWNSRVERVLDQLDFQITVSVDGFTAPTFERIRVGASFAEVYANIERFRQYTADRGTPFSISWSLVRQNWFELGSMLLWAEERAIPVTVQTVLEPEFGVQAAPTDELRRIVEALEAEDATVRPLLRLNSEMWDRELRRLQDELRQRDTPVPLLRAMRGPEFDNAEHVLRTILGTEGPPPGGAGGARLDLDALAAWTDPDRPIVSLALDDLGAVSHAHDLSSLLPDDVSAPAVDGLRFDQVLLALAEPFGGGVWLLEEFVEHGHVEHLLFLGRTVRDKTGLILRLLTRRRTDGGVDAAVASSFALLHRPPCGGEDLGTALAPAVPVSLSMTSERMDAGATAFPRSQQPVSSPLGMNRRPPLPPQALHDLRRAVPSGDRTSLDAVRPLLGTLTSSHRPVGLRRVVVAPGTAAPMTCRPTAIDPAAGAAVELVLALTDAVGHAGQLRFRPRRGRPSLRPIEADAPSNARQGLHDVPLTAGESVVLDDGVAWCTHPNHSDAPTEYLVVTLLPRDVPATLYRSGSTGELEAAPVSDDDLALFLQRGTVPVVEWEAAPARVGEDSVRRSLGSTARDIAVHRVIPAARTARHSLSNPYEIPAVATACRKLGRLTDAASTANATRLATRGEGTSAGPSAIEGALTFVDALDPGPATSLGVPRWATRLHALRASWRAEFDATRAEVDLPPAEFLLGVSADDATGGDRRLAIVQDRRWLERAVERAPLTSDALRRLDDLVGAHLVELAPGARLHPDPDGRAGVSRAVIPLDGDSDPADVRFTDRRRVESAFPPGSYLVVDVATPSRGALGAATRGLQRLRQHRPSAPWTEHRLAEWERRHEAEVEPPEGVLVEHYEDFADHRLSIRMLRSARGRAELFDALSVPCIMWLVQLNNRLISRHLRGTPAMWDPSRFGWVPQVERAWPDIRAEVESLMASGQWVPTVREVVGVEREAERPAVGSTTEWRNYILFHRGHWMEWNCRACPRTTEVVRDIPGLNFAFFSILEPHGHIARHRGPNRGALRHHVGVMIPQPPELCTIEINGIPRHWEEGRTMMFDLTSEHEVWNHSDEPRVLLMCEVNTPLPRGLREFNRVTQAVYSAMPPFRRMKAHLRALEEPQRG